MIIKITFFAIFCFLFKINDSLAEYESLSLGKTENKEFYTAPVQYEWLEAFDACKSRNLEFAIVESEEENKLLTKFLKNQKDVENGKFWIAASDYFHEREFTHIKNQRLISYTNWRLDETENDYDKNCIVVSPDGKWDYVPCHPGQHLALCQKTFKDTSIKNPKWESTKTSGAYINKERKIKNSNKFTNIGQVGSKIFYLEKEGPGSERVLPLALDLCQEYGFSLATFRTVEEQKFILNISKHLESEGSLQPVIWGTGTNFYATDEYKDFYWLEDVEKIRETEFLKLGSDGGRNKCIGVYPEEFIRNTGCVGNTWRAVCEINIF